MASECEAFGKGLGHEAGALGTGVSGPMKETLILPPAEEDTRRIPLFASPEGGLIKHRGCLHLILNFQPAEPGEKHRSFVSPPSSAISSGTL